MALARSKTIKISDFKVTAAPGALCITSRCGRLMLNGSQDDVTNALKSLLDMAHSGGETSKYSRFDNHWFTVLFDKFDSSYRPAFWIWEHNGFSLTIRFDGDMIANLESLITHSMKLCPQE